MVIDRVGRGARCRLFVLLVGVLLAAKAGADVCSEVPADALRADLDGDGRDEQVWRLPPDSELGGRTRAYDPWRRQVRSLERGATGLVIAWGRPVVAGGRCTLIQNLAFFSSPIWGAESPPIALLKHDSGTARPWRAKVRRWRGDGVLLGTEAGADVLLYWDGRSFRLAYDGEAP